MLRFLVLIACAPLVAGCGGTTTKTVTETVTRVETVEVESAAPAAVPSAVADGGAPALATAPRRVGQVIFKGEGLASVGPKTFKGGVYMVRFEQWAPDEPDLNFRSDASSIVIQLNRKPGKIGADAVTVTNATKKKGKTSVTVPAGRWYADVQADHAWAVRFTPIS